jgi:succinate dehydrogenase hydrophobic anchor subunit
MDTPLEDRQVDRAGHQSPRVVRRGLFTWLMVRVTGLILTVLVIGHFALTHILTDVAETDATFVTARWASALTIGWDWLMLASAVLHGAAGLRVVIGDYAPDRARRPLVGLLLLLSLGMTALGTWTIVHAVLA